MGLEGGFCLAAQGLAQGLQVSSCGQLATVVVAQSDPHVQTIGQGDCAQVVLGRTGLAAMALQLTCQRGVKVTLCKSQARQALLDSVRCGNKLSALRFGQAFDQLLDLVAQQTGDQPVKALWVELVELGHRHIQIDAIIFIAGGEHVLDLEMVSMHRQAAGKGLAEIVLLCIA